MADWTGDAVERLRRPEYTGENRCRACTAVNVAIAMVASGLLGLASPPLGIVTFAVSVALIYIRGYLVPGTPEMTRRYLPERILRYFDEHPARRTTASDGPQFETLEKLAYEREHAVDETAFLWDVEAVEETSDGPEATEAFASDVWRRVERRRDEPVSPGDVAELFQVSPDGLEFQDRDYPAMKVGLRIRKWPSEGALRADVANHEALVARSDRWLDVPQEQRLEILETLRTYLRECPTCRGRLAFHDETVESCCGEYEVAVYGCVDCEERLVELDPTKVDDDTGATGIVPGFE